MPVDKLAAIIFAAVLNRVDSAAFVGISKLSSNVGSYYGESRLIIEGFGFDRGGLDGTTEVSVGQQTCIVDQYLSGARHIECITPEAVEKRDQNLEVVVYVIAPNEIGYASSNYFYYRESVTPYIDYVTAGTFPGNDMMFTGSLRQSDKTLYDIRLSDYGCAVWDNVTDSYSTGYCQLTDEIEAGYKSFDFNAKSSSANTAGSVSYGLAGVRFDAFGLDVTNGNLYSTVVAPRVDLLSTDSSSLQGGQDLVIEGIGFSSNATNVTVTIGGVDCPIKSSTINKVTCGPLPSSSANSVVTSSDAYSVADSLNSFVALGKGSGLTWRSFTPLSGSNPDYTKPLFRGVHVGDLKKISSSFDLNSRNNYILESYGFLDVPGSGDYRFLCKGDDSVIFELSTDSTAANLQSICTNSIYRSSFFAEPDQQSDFVTLVQGSQYLFRLRLVEGSGDDSATVGVIVKNAASNNLSGFEGIQNVDSSIVKSKMGVKEVREVRFVKTSSDKTGCSARYQIIMGGEKATTEITSISDSSIKSALVALGYASDSLLVESLGFDDWTTYFPDATANIGYARYVVHFPVDDEGAAIPSWEWRTISITNCTIETVDQPAQVQAVDDILLGGIPAGWIRRAIPDVAAAVEVTVGGVPSVYVDADDAGVVTANAAFKTSWIYYTDSLALSILDSTSLTASPIQQDSSFQIIIDTSTIPTDSSADDWSVEFDDPALNATISNYDASTGTISFIFNGIGSGGTQSVRLLHKRVGAALITSSCSIQPTITTVSPVSNLSTAGGAKISVTGYNFGSWDSTNSVALIPAVTVNGVAATVLSGWTSSAFNFYTPAVSEGDYNVNIDGVEYTTSTLSFSDSVTATVTSVTPDQVPYGKSAFITLSGSQLNLGLTDAWTLSSTTVGTAPVEVTVGNRTCVIESINADGSELTCLLRRGYVQSELASESYTAAPVVRVSSGLAAVDASVTIDMSFEVSSLSISQTGHYGAFIEVTGRGFTASKLSTATTSSIDVRWVTQYVNGTAITDMELPCTVFDTPTTDENDLFSSFTCFLDSLCVFGAASGASVKSGAETVADALCKEGLPVTGKLVFYSQYITASCGSSNCDVQLVSVSWPSINSISPDVGSEGTSITISATNAPSGIVPKIYFGGRYNISTAISATCDTETTCSVPADIPAGSYWIRFLYEGYGFANSADSIIFTQEMILDSFSIPVYSSLYGGIILSATGNGFGLSPLSSLSVKLGANNCTLTTASSTSFTCVVPAASSSSSASVDISVQFNSYDLEDWNLANNLDTTSDRRRRLCGVEHDTVASIASENAAASGINSVPIYAANRALIYPLAQAKRSLSASAIALKPASQSAQADFKRMQKEWIAHAIEQLNFAASEEFAKEYAEHDPAVILNADIHTFNNRRIPLNEEHHHHHAHEKHARISQDDTIPVVSESDFDLFKKSHHIHSSNSVKSRRLNQIAAITTQTRSVSIRDWRVRNSVASMRRLRRLQTTASTTGHESIRFSSSDCSTRFSYVKNLQFSLTRSTVSDSVISITGTAPTSSFTPSLDCLSSTSITPDSSYTVYIGATPISPSYTYSELSAGISVNIPSDLNLGSSTIRVFGAQAGYLPITNGDKFVNTTSTISVSNAPSYGGSVLQLSGDFADWNSGVAATDDLPFYTNSSVTGLTSVFALQNQGSNIIGTYFSGLSSNLRPYTVSACGVDCPVTSVSSGVLSCVMPEMMTTKDLTQLKSDGFLAEESTSVLPYTAIIAPTAAQSRIMAAAFDGLIETQPSSAVSNCYLGIDVGEGFIGHLTGVEWYPYYGESRRIEMIGTTFSYSLDNVTWVNFLTQSDRPVEGWNKFGVANFTGGAALSARFFKITPPSTASNRCTYFREIRLKGYRVLNSDDGVCNVKVNVKSSDVAFKNAFNPSTTLETQFTSQFTFDYTGMPKVTGASPSSGKSLGGDSVIVSGSNLDAIGLVQLSGTTCVSPAATSSSVSCTTAKRSSIQSENILLSSSAGLALVMKDVTFYYVDRWSDVRTWEDYSPPEEGDSVVIPFGQRIVLDESTPVLNLLLVEGVLEVERKGGMTLQATYFWMAGGEFHIGSAEEPFTDDFNVILHGTRATVELPHIIGCKVMVATPTDDRLGGLFIYGAPTLRTWTSLASSAAANSNVLVLQEAVDWVEGDRLVLTHQTDMWKTEEVFVASISSDGLTITLKSNLVYDHNVEITDLSGYLPSASAQTAKDKLSSTYMGCEVGLVSRKVRFRGDDTSPGEKFGMHSMAQHGSALHMEHVEVTWCGQQGVVGHYCTHFHMPGDLPDGYIGHNSIHHSFQRASTIHSVRKATVEYNVDWDICGHSIFIEDANEMYNSVVHNLVVITRRNPVLLSGDLKPASFWTPNPNNYFRENVAAGSVSFGFWFELKDHPTGPSYTETICPVGEDLGEFTNNRAHNNDIGLRVYPQFLPRDPPCGGSLKKPQYFRGTTSHHNNQGFFHKIVTDIHHSDSAFVYNSQGGAWLRFQDMYFDQDPNFLDSVFAGSTSSSEDHSRNGIEMPQREYWRLKNVAFVNFPNQFAMLTCHDCNSGEEYSQGAYTYRMEGIQFSNAPIKIQWGTPKKEIIHDIDGSVSGVTDSYITYAYNHLDMDVCTRDTAGEFVGGTVCTEPVRKIGFKYVNPSAYDNKQISVSSNTYPTTETLEITSGAVTAPSGSSLFANIDYRTRGPFSGWTIPVVINRFYNITWASTNGPNFEQVQIVYSDPEYVFNYNAANSADPEFAGLTFRHNEYRDRFEVTLPLFNPDPEDGVIPDKDSLPNKVVTGLQSGLDLADDFDVFDLLTSYKDLPFGTFVHSGMGDIGKFALMLSTGVNVRGDPQTISDPYTVSVKARECPEIGCWAPPSLAELDEPHLWSNASGWAVYGKTIPVDGEDVVIGNTQYVILDVDTAKMGVLEIQGKLEFKNELSTDQFTLKANSIVVWGVMEVGTPAKPLLPKSTIIFHGTKDTSTTTVIEDGLFLGGKGLTVVGTLSMVGREVALPWTTLAETAAAGATSIKVFGSGALNWSVGDELILGGTSFHSRNESETVTVASIDSTAVYDDDGQAIITVTISSALQYSHISVSNTFEDRQVEVRAPVGHLSRSILIRDETESGIRADGYGWNLNIVSKRPVYGRSGTSRIRFVSMRNAGKRSASQAAINYDYSATFTNTSYAADFDQLLDACVIESLNLGIWSNHTQNVQLARNIITRSMYYGIEFDDTSLNARINNNLVMNIERDPEWQTDWYVPFSGIAMLATPLEMRANYVSGSDDTGIYYNAPDCPDDVITISRSYSPEWPGTEATYDDDGNVLTSAVTGAAISDNVIVGVVVGVLPVPHPYQRCKVLNGFTVSYASHIGLLLVDEFSNVLISNNTVTDSHIGLSFNGMSSKTQTFALSNNTIVGETSDTVDCSINANDCLAYDEFDVYPAECNSVFKDKSMRRVGLLTAQNYNKGKTCYHAAFDMTCRPLTKPERMCALPWEGEMGVRAGHRTIVDSYGTVFANFLETACSYRSVAVSSNPQWEDFVGEFIFEKTSWVNTVDAAKLELGFADCYRSGYDNDDICDAAQLLFGEDIDGTFTGRDVAGAFTAKTAYKMADSAKCVAIPELDQLRFCEGLTLRPLVVENMDVDTDRHIGPITFEATKPYGYEDSSDYSTISYGTNGLQKMEPCSLSGYWGINSGGVHPGRTYKVSLSATNPSTTRVYYYGKTGEDIKIEFFFIQPLKLQVFIGDASTAGQLVNSNGSDGPNVFDNGNGAYMFDPQYRYLHVVLKGDDTGFYTGSNYIEIRTLPVVQLTLTGDVLLSEFRSSDLISNIAALLSIDPTRIKVADPGFIDNYSVRRRRLDATPSEVQQSMGNAPSDLPGELSTDPQANTLNDDSTVSLDKTLQIYVEPTNQDVSNDPDTTLSQLTDLLPISNQISSLISSGDLTSSLSSSLGLWTSSISASVYAATTCGSVLLCPQLSIAPVSVSFQDTNGDNLVMSGVIKMNPPSSETALNGYIFYWGDSSGNIMSDYSNSPIFEVTKGDTTYFLGSQYQITVSNVEIKGYRILAYAYDSYGISISPASVSLLDLVGYDYQTPALSNSDTDGSTGSTSKSKEDGGSSKTAIIIGCAVGGCCAIIAAVVATIWIRRVRQRRRFQSIEPVGANSFNIAKSIPNLDDAFDDPAQLAKEETEPMVSGREQKAQSATVYGKGSPTSQEEALNKLNDWLKEQRKKKENRRLTDDRGDSAARNKKLYGDYY